MGEKEMFERYENVRASGIFNMITEATPAMSVAGLTTKDYFYVIEHYSELKEKYGKKEDF